MTPEIAPKYTETVRQKQYKVDRLDHFERWVKLGGIIGTFILVVALCIAVLVQNGQIGTLTENDKTHQATDKTLKCGLSALAQFAGGVAQFADTPPAPNAERSTAVDLLNGSVPALTAASQGKCLKSPTPTVTTSP